MAGHVVRQCSKNASYWALSERQFRLCEKRISNLVWNRFHRGVFDLRRDRGDSLGGLSHKALERVSQIVPQRLNSYTHEEFVTKVVDLYQAKMSGLSERALLKAIEGLEKTPPLICRDPFGNFVTYYNSIDLAEYHGKELDLIDCRIPEVICSLSIHDRKRVFNYIQEEYERALRLT